MFDREDSRERDAAGLLPRRPGVFCARSSNHMPPKSRPRALYKNDAGNSHSRREKFIDFEQVLARAPARY